MLGWAGQKTRKQPAQSRPSARSIACFPGGEEKRGPIQHKQINEQLQNKNERLLYWHISSQQFMGANYFLRWRKIKVILCLDCIWLIFHTKNIFNARWLICGHLETRRHQSGKEKSLQLCSLNNLFIYSLARQIVLHTFEQGSRLREAWPFMILMYPFP